MYAAYGVSRVMTVSSWKSSMRRWICATSQPTTSPTATPPAARPARSARRRCVSEKLPVATAASAKLVGDQAGGVVDQALALEDGDDPARHLEPLRDRGGGDGVGRRHDRAQHERDRPAHARDHARARPTRPRSSSPPPGRSASRAIGRRLAAKSRHEVNQAAANSSGGRNSSSTSSGSMCTRGSPGTNASARPADDEQDRVGDLQALGRDRQRRGDDQQNQNQLERVHARRI